MARQLTITIKGAKEFQRVLERSPEIAGEEMANAMNSTALDVQRFAIGYAPARTGSLARSIKVVKANAKKLLALVGTNLFYAPYQEFGTGIFVGKGYIYPKRAKVLRFKTRGGKWVFARRVKGTPPKKYMTRARQDGVRAFGVYTDKALTNITHRLATEN